jgi:ketosteroid isomerase-like protein
MKHHSLLLAAVAVVLTSVVDGAPVVRPSEVESQRTESPMLTQARRAFSAYIDAAEHNDRGRLQSIFTKDAVVEYITRGPALYSDADGRSLGIECVREAAKLSLERRFEIRWLWYEGSGDEVFVEYQVSIRAPGRTTAITQPQMAMVVMQGDRIARFRSFGLQCTSTPFF